MCYYRAVDCFSLNGFRFKLTTNFALFRRSTKDRLSPISRKSSIGSVPRANSNKPPIGEICAKFLAGTLCALLLEPESVRLPALLMTPYVMKLRFEEFFPAIKSNSTFRVLFFRATTQDKLLGVQGAPATSETLMKCAASMHDADLVIEMARSNMVKGVDQSGAGSKPGNGVPRFDVLALGGRHKPP